MALNIALLGINVSWLIANSATAHPYLAALNVLGIPAGAVGCYYNGKADGLRQANEVLENALRD